MNTSGLTPLIGEGTRVGENVQLVAPLNRGAMGELWRANHLTLGVEVAVKFLGRNFLDHAMARERFGREAKAAARMVSAYAVRHFDHGVLDDHDGPSLPFIIMELLEGASLDEHVPPGGCMPPSEVLTMARHVGAALREADRHEIVHRDVKPENIFRCTVGRETTFKVLDFGIARLPETVADGAQRMTRAGELMGTPPFMSPEMFISAEDAEHADDLWSLAVVVYWGLTGRVPFRGDTPREVHQNVRERCFVPASDLTHGIDADRLDAFFARAFHHRLHRRFLFVDDLVDSLTTALSSKPRAAAIRPTAPGATGSAAAAGGAAADEEDASPSLRPARPDTASARPVVTSEPARAPRRREWLSVVAAAAILVVGLVVATLMQRDGRDMTTKGRESAAGVEGDEAPAAEVQRPVPAAAASPPRPASRPRPDVRVGTASTRARSSSTPRAATVAQTPTEATARSRADATAAAGGGLPTAAPGPTGSTTAEVPAGPEDDAASSPEAAEDETTAAAEADEERAPAGDDEAHEVEDEAREVAPPVPPSAEPTPPEPPPLDAVGTAARPAPAAP
ncbi:MAG: serine/threonine-protein kinase [Myxococcota bacterium]